MEKILLIDKPRDWTSFDVVAKLRNAFKKSTNNKNAKVGHAGTLDPFATGLLILLLGAATKKQDEFMKLDKEYIATLKLGFISTTGDPEGTITPYKNEKSLQPSLENINNILQKFNGEISQIPPAFSAIKVNGTRAYKIAREGKEVKIEPRKIKIYKIEVLSYNFPELTISVNCSSGTYIRTLASDIGAAIGTGAYLTDLKRTKIGKYSLAEAISVQQAVSDLNLEKN